MRTLKEWLETLNAIGAAILVIVLVALLFFADMSLAAGSAHAGETAIPRAALQYRGQLIREARAVWGMEAPVAIFAAQIHTESNWAKRCNEFRGGAGVGAVHAVDGGMAAQRGPGNGHARRRSVLHGLSGPA